MSELPGDFLNEPFRERGPVPEFETEIAERPGEGAAPFRQQAAFAAPRAGKGYPLVAAEPETDGVKIARVMRAENLLAAQDLLTAGAFEFDSVAASIEYPAPGQKFETPVRAFNMPGNLDPVLPNDLNRIRVGLDRMMIVGPGRMTSEVAAVRFDGLCYDDSFADKPFTDECSELFGVCRTGIDVNDDLGIVAHD